MKPFAFRISAIVCCLLAFQLTTTALLAQAAAEAKKEERPRGKGNFVPPPLSPEVNADHTVTFRLRAPNAHEVKVSGEWPKGTSDMTKDDKGVWSVTVGPLPPEIYGYGFVVDGLRMADQVNPNLKPMRSPTTSILEIPGDPPLLHEFQDVPHGTVSLHDYRSKSLGVLRHFRVYTPPGYEQNPTHRYPVLYLLHGSGDNEGTWTVMGRANCILDNLIAQGKAKPMVIVMTDGHASAPNFTGVPSAGMISRNVEDYAKDLLGDVMPLAENRYRIMADRDHRAIVGLSMGGGQSLYVGLNNLDKFGWVGGMSSAARNGEAMAAGAIADPRVNQKLKLLWIAIGKDDGLLKANEEFVAVLKQHHINHEFIVTEGNHSWPVWRKHLAQFAPLLFQPQ